MAPEKTLKARARRERASGRRLGGATLWLSLALGCFAQKPSGESAPSAPAAPASEPEPSPAAAPGPAAPPPAPAESLRKEESGAATGGQGAAVPSPSAAPPRRMTVPAPAKPALKRSASEAREGDSESERAIGGNADDAQRDAPALRQRLDRAYRAGSPDCPSARERKKAVCDLATQICQLTDRDPNVASVAEYCSEAKARCSQADRRTQERCPD